MKILRKGSLLAATWFMFAFAACNKSDVPAEQTPQDESCIQGNLGAVTGDKGKAFIFWPDPIVSSSLPLLGPSSLQLDQYHKEVDLKNLGGRGILEGRYVDVRNGLSCNEGFGAFSERNEFFYGQRDERFQQGMAYYVGDAFRSSLDSAGYLDKPSALRVIAPCAAADNAFYAREKDTSGRIIEKVCLGISLSTPGAYYADDASVIVHEIQHGATGNMYHPTQELNAFFYDEAGALNEGVSDFMALMFIAPSVPDAFDPRLFGRWALGTFSPNRSSARGAHKCPTYDSDFPRCANYPAFSATNNTVSLVYPDGLGWPFPRTYSGPGFLRSAYLGNHFQEEIHANALILEGALWDAYDALRSRHAGDVAEAQRLMTRVVLEALKHLPKPTTTNLSPVTFRGMAQAMVDFAPSVGFSASDMTALTDALTERGLYAGATITDASWSAIDSDEALRVKDKPAELRAWLYMLGSDPNQVTQGNQTGLNSQLDPGEVVTLWFNIKNISPITAGGVLVKIRSLNPDVTFLNGNTNIGAVSESEAQILYSKINGTQIVSALASGNSNYDVPAGNSYFKTNPFFDETLLSAVWVKVAPSAGHGTKARFEVTSVPSNGVPSTSTFEATIQ